MFNSGAPLANDIAARTALAEKSIATIVRGAAPAAATKIKVVAGQVTITTPAAAYVKAGDVVTLAGFGVVSGVDLGMGASNINGENTVTSATASSITFGADADDIAETAVAAGNNALETVQKAVRQASEMADANVKAMAASATQGSKSAKRR